MLADVHACHRLVGTACAALVLFGAPVFTCAQVAPNSQTSQTAQVAQDDTAALKLVSSAYPPVSTSLSRLWLAPDASLKARLPRALTNLAEAVRLEADGKYARALPLVPTSGAAGTPLADYATYLKGVLLMRLGKVGDARSVFEKLRQKEPVGYLSEAVRVREAEAAQAQGDYQAAIQLYEELVDHKTNATDALLLGLARAATAAGDRERAARALTRLYYDYPLSDLSADAGKELESYRDLAPMDAAERFKKDAARAQKLFDARRYPAAEPVFQSLIAQAPTPDDRERMGLRVAECAFYLGRYREARDLAKPFTENAARKAEAQYYYLSAVRELGDQDEYVRLAHTIASEFPTSSWVEETLNNLASSYIIADDDEKADETFRDLYARFPKGKHAERAAWKVGWFAYRRSRYADTVKYFESAAAAFAHSDYRPAYLYWSARAHEALGERDLADARYRLVLTDYRNTYYGRLTSVRLAAGRPATPDIEPIAVKADVADTPMPANAEQIRTLLALGLDDQAMDELLYAQRAWGDSPVIGATIAWVYNQRGDLRAGITAMKRAYPQYMAAGGEQLPADIRRVMYPLDFWASIKRQATSKHLDPYLVAALILQESSFEPGAKSGANAIGLMQIIAPTGRRYARSLRIRRFSPAMLTRAETNLRLGVAYFSDLVNRFGGTHLALASYNAGESRVSQWMSERQGLSREEFIDDIPFPETQNYVKRILSAADDYRLLYGGATAGPTTPGAAFKKAVVKADAAPTIRPNAGAKASVAKAGTTAKKKPAVKRASSKSSSKPKAKKPTAKKPSAKKSATSKANG